MKTGAGLFGGCLGTGILLILGGTGILSWQLTAWIAVFAGGLIAGLLTRGTGWDGALAGAPSGGIVAAGMGIRVLMDAPAAGGDWTGIVAFFLLPAVFFIPSNAICGAMGSTIRRIGEKRASPAGTQTESARAAERLRWTGILIGALIIPVSMAVAGSLSLLLIIPPLAGGLIAGFLSSGGLRSGAESGFLAAILGIGILAVPVIWFGSQGTGFAAGLAGIVLIVMAFFSLPASIAGGIIGAHLRKRIREGG
jgi:hypothetical protein